MFAYCGNNPASCCDPSGQYAKYVPVVFDGEDVDVEEDDSTPNYGATFSVGASGSIGIGPWAVGGQLFITIDSNGYIAVQYGYVGGLSVDPTPAGFSGSFGPFIMLTNAVDYRGLEGPSAQIGVSTIPCVIDYNVMLDQTAEQILYHGISLSPGGITPGMHVMWGEGYTLFACELDWDAFHFATQY